MTSRSNYDLIVTLFVALLLISNVAATKLIAFGPEWAPFGIPVLPVVTDGGALLFPLTYICGDVLAEVFGMRGARRAIWTGFGISLLASLTFLLVGIAPPAADWPNQEAFVAVLGFVPRIVVASLAGYLVGQFLNAWVLIRLKRHRGGLWSRLVGSTVIGEAADTTLFCLIAFGGLVDASTMANYIVVGYLFKVGVEVLLLPVTTRVIVAVRRREADQTISMSG
ncbi:VUT family protein [Arachnia propionica]|uniref:Probable queuosine precursor transporter n=1 Tax=Arachnia propionica TaxID=1750 RepID=A0A3P1TEF9_9ACTN|nr:queuosine precursor transporter [Arachnia propionica]MDO5081852.1 queuosine precursor transporter [Arachnia propionica]RRD07296.1 VUT family protein [Arachnia propionica]